MTKEDYLKLNKLTGKMNKYYFITMMRYLEDIEAHPGLPGALFFLNDNPGMPQNKLAKMLHINKATISVRLQRMEKSGYIYRENDEHDQRITRVYLTEKGKELQVICMDRVLIFLEELYTCLDEKELEMMELIQVKLLNRLQEMKEKIEINKGEGNEKSF